MILKSKICGVSDSKVLNFIVNHDHPPQFVGFIVNFPKSKRYIDIKNLKELIKIDKKKSLYVAVLVNPEKNILEEIKDLPFDYYQLYDCDPNKIKSITKTPLHLLGLLKIIQSKIDLLRERNVKNCSEMKKKNPHM